MGLPAYLADAVTSTFSVFKAPRNVSLPWAPFPAWQAGVPALADGKYETYAREGYMANEIIFACINELGSSASEPDMIAKVGQEWIHQHPILTLLNNPNPFMERTEFLSTVIMHLSLAGNAYALKIRSGSGKVVEMWLLRPDMVKVVPSKTGFIDRYEFRAGNNDPISIPVGDIVHFKTIHPLSPFYGMPPLMAISQRTDLDNFLTTFTKQYFANSGMPGGLLAVKQTLNKDAKEEIRRNFRTDYGGSRVGELMIIDNSEATFTPMTQSLGTRGLVVPELNKIIESRICMVFQVPPALIGAEVGMGNSSYANLVMQQRFFWDNTLAPLYQSLAGRLTAQLVPDFANVSAVDFDLSEVRALQEDADQVATRWSNLAQKGVASLQEARAKVGLPAEWDKNAVFLVPSSSAPMQGDDLEEPVIESAPAPQLPAPRGRPTTANDAEARALWQKGEELRVLFPAMTNEQIAARIGVSVSTYWRYRTTFDP
jgi:HK97 family phage portal protein